MANGFFYLMCLAVTLIAASTAQFAAAGIAARQAGVELRRRRAADVRGLRQAAQVARLTSELQSAPAAEGVAWRVMEVAEIIDESRDCRSFYLVDPYGQPLPGFLPGQHVLVRPALSGGLQTTRCYSLSSAPAAGYWRITVKREPEAGSQPSGVAVERLRPARNRGQTGGLSRWLHAHIGVGDCLLVGGPNGHFALTPDHERPLILLAAGVGVTPLASMLRWSLEHTPQRPVHLLYQVADAEHWPLGRELHALVAAATACRVTTYFSRLTPSDVAEISVPPLTGMGADQVAGAACLMPGKFDGLQAVQGMTSGAADFYLCGPPEWMKNLSSELVASGIAPQRLHQEAFAAPRATAAQSPAEIACGLQVRFEASGVQACWGTTDHSLWEMAREHHVHIPSGCLSGVCGCCRVKLLAGKVAYDRPPAVDLPANECLACIARPVTDCRIDA